MPCPDIDNSSRRRTRAAGSILIGIGAACLIVGMLNQPFFFLGSAFTAAFAGLSSLMLIGIICLVASCVNSKVPDRSMDHCTCCEAHSCTRHTP